MVYRYQPRASAPIDAGEVVADNGKVGDYRYISLETPYPLLVALKSTLTGSGNNAYRPR